MEFRIEKDTMGEVKVPAEKSWGAQTQRSLDNFKIGEELMPHEIIKAFAALKRAAARANFRLGMLEETKADAITKVCDDIYAGKFMEEFPLSVWQTGSGTQTNMNINEVIAHLTGLHPNDEVNRGQSSNDTFPTAMHIAFVAMAESDLLPAVNALRATFEKLSEKYADIVKTGRTHLMDATPLTLGQEISAWYEMLDVCYKMVEQALEPVRLLALGGTAVGTGLNTHHDFGSMAAYSISEYTGFEFKSAPNKFHALSAKDAASGLSGALRTLACDLMKIANDVRWLASGPRCGIGELIIPANEPGSSIMPGKVNPTQCEALAMVCARVMGNDVTVGIGASQGNFELNVYMPVIAYSVIQSIRLLADAIHSFNGNCAIGIRPNEAVIARYLEDSLMLVTALSPRLGYEKAAEIAKYAYENGTGLREATVERGILTEDEYNFIIDPKKML
ncbi:MAG: class II fumarate hydratase [Clostridiales Family XIII bacterium]|jgi:fumarate hydratase class II|nr:class II fumarate hydratase [Clostridiales Family XIII bacterium]